MNYRILAAALIFSFACLCPAAARAATLLAEAPPKTARLNEVVKFGVISGYHFNGSAPQVCGARPAFDVSGGGLKCQFTSGGGQAVLLNICDDKNTSCMTEEFTVQVEGKPAARADAGAAAQVPEEPPLEGFLLNVPARALRQARREKKLLFIDFFGKWCPPCRVMEETVLNRPEFLAASRGMVRVSLDIDRPLAREWVSRFRVSGYPTFLVADARLREIGRWTGSGNLEAFVLWVKEQERWKWQPIEKATSAAAVLDEAGKVRVARYYMDAENWGEARAALKGARTRYAAYLDAAAQLKTAEASGAAGLTAMYMEFIERFDGRDGQDAESGVMDWIGALCKLAPAAGRPYLEGLDALAGRLQRSGDVLKEGYLAPDILTQLASALDEAGLPEQAAVFNGRAADAYAALAGKAGSAGQAKGLRMSQAKSLMGAGRYEDAAAVYAALAESFPGEYPFHRSYANALLKLKKYPEALKEAALAANLSYGDIKLNVLLTKARIEMAQNDKAAAVRTLRDAMAGADLPGDSKLPTHGAYQGLKDYLKEVEAAD
ncbi:MAG: thioredoxin family protein [Elusimicrobia bacterium]|nr:thioredoxin family protein [Elusimicrobiota bacterium]